MCVFLLKIIIVINKYNNNKKQNKTTTTTTTTNHNKTETKQTKPKESFFTPTQPGLLYQGDKLNDSVIFIHQTRTLSLNFRTKHRRLSIIPGQYFFGIRQSILYNFGLFVQSRVEQMPPNKQFLARSTSFLRQFILKEADSVVQTVWHNDVGLTVLRYRADIIIRDSSF